MNKIYSLVTLLLTASASAQPVLDETNSAPSIGNSFTVNLGTFVAPAAGGINQTWDFSGQVSGGSTQIQYVDPAGTTAGATFSFADYAETASGSPETRYFDSETLGTVPGVYNLGYANTNGFIMPYAAPIRQRPYPCAHLDTWNGNYGGNTIFMGIQFFIDGTFDGEADGYGTLIMPWGTVNNVLRTHLVIHETQAIIGAQSDYIQDYYEYYVAGVAYPLVRTYDLKEDLGGGSFVQMDQTLQWMDPLTTEVTEISAPLVLSIFPNPAHGQVTVNCTGVSKLEVLDATGRILLNEQNGNGAEQQLDISGLTPGIYTLQVIDATGRRAAQRLVVR